MPPIINARKKGLVFEYYRQLYVESVFFFFVAEKRWRNKKEASRRPVMSPGMLFQQYVST